MCAQNRVTPTRRFHGISCFGIFQKFFDILIVPDIEG